MLWPEYWYTGGYEIIRVLTIRDRQRAQMKFEPVLNLSKIIETALFVDGSKFHLSALSVPKSSSVVMGCLSTAVYWGGSWDNGPGDPYLLGLFSHKQKATKAHRPK